MESSFDKLRMNISMVSPSALLRAGLSNHETFILSLSKDGLLGAFSDEVDTHR